MIPEKEHYRLEAREKLKKLHRRQVCAVADRFGVDYSGKDTKEKIYAAIESREDSDGVLPGSYLQVAEDDGVLARSYPFLSK